MDRFEYQTMTAATQGALDELLNTRAQKGWRPISILPHNSKGFIVTFERKIEHRA